MIFTACSAIAVFKIGIFVSIGGIIRSASEMSVVRFISVNTVHSADNLLKILFGSRFGSLFLEKNLFLSKKYVTAKNR